MDGISVVVSHSCSSVWDHFVFGCSSLLLCVDLYTARYDLHFTKFLLVWFFNHEFS